MYYYIAHITFCVRFEDFKPLKNSKFRFIKMTAEEDTTTVAMTTKASESSSLFAVDDALHSRPNSHDELLDLLASSSFTPSRRGKKGEFESAQKLMMNTNNVDTTPGTTTTEENDARSAASFSTSPSLSFQTPQNLSQLRTRARMSPPLLQMPGGIGNTSVSPRSSNGSKGGSPFFSNLSSSPEREVCAICMCRLDDVESPRVSREDLASLVVSTATTTTDDGEDGKENETKQHQQRKKKEIYTLPCTHRFHRSCLGECRANDFSQCPMCRESLPGGLTPDHVRQMKAKMEQEDPDAARRAYAVQRNRAAREAVRAAALRRQMAAGVFSSSPTNSMSLSTPSQQPRTPLACPPGVGGTSPASASGSGEKVGGGTSVGGSLRRTSSGVASGDASTDKKPPLPPRGVPLNGGGDEAYNRHRRQRSNLTEQLAKAENLDEDEDDFDMDDLDMDLSQSQKSDYH